NGGFAQFATVKSAEAYKINSDWTDEEFSSIPCSYSTAENMLHRIGLGAETVLITGASGGVGSAAVQLAKRRGAQVIALCSLSKADEVLACGADRVIDRNADLVKELGKESIDVVIDLIGGPQWPSLLEVLRKG
ncbi:zinc-binding dehydrogenase, partial [Pseudomonas aeruginosa]